MSFAEIDFGHLGTGESLRELADFILPRARRLFPATKLTDGTGLKHYSEDQVEEIQNVVVLAAAAIIRLTGAHDVKDAMTLNLKSVIKDINLAVRSAQTA